MSLRETLEAIRNQPTPPNEAMAKNQIVVWTLQGLGWNPFSPAEVVYEDDVTTSRGTGRVDIALLGEDHSVAHIEVKAPGQDLNRHAKQALGYAFEEGVHICALTNGLTWQLYLPREAGKHHQKLFATLRLQNDPIDRVADDLETFLGKNNLLSGDSEDRARKVLEARRQADRLNVKLPGIWSRMVQEPDEKLVELMIDRAYDELNLRPAPEQVRAVLRGSPVPAVPESDPATPAAQPQAAETGAQDPQQKRRSPRKGAKIVAYVLWGERHDVNKWNAMLVGVAEALYERHGQDFAGRILDLQSRKLPYASRSENDVRAPKEIGSSGLYMHTNLSAAAIRRRANELLELFGYRADDLVIESRTD